MGGYKLLRKALLIFACICFLVIIIAIAYEPQGKVDGTEVIIGHSEKFTRAEIDEAISQVKIQFREFKGCKLIKLWYDEDWSNKTLENWNVEKENYIVLLSDFETDYSASGRGFEPNRKYTHVNWILKRKNKSANWEVINWGY